MTGGVPSVQRADDAHPLEENGSAEENGAVTFESGLSEPCLDAAAAETQFEHSQLKAHEMQAVLARATEAGEFDGAVVARSAAGEAALLNVLAVLESAKDKLDRVRLRA